MPPTPQRKQRKQQELIEVLPRIIAEVEARMSYLRPAYEEYVKLMQVKTELAKVSDTGKAD